MSQEAPAECSRDIFVLYLEIYLLTFSSSLSSTSAFRLTYTL